MTKKDDPQWDESICVSCGNNQENKCVAGKVDSFDNMVIIACPDYYKGDTIITINQEGMRAFIEENFPEYVETLTGKQLEEFMQFLFDDVSNWLKVNWEAFNDKAASDGIKKLMEEVKKEEPED